MSNTNYSDGLLNLLYNVPEDIRQKLAKASKNEEILKGKVELTVIFGDSVDKVKAGVDKIGGSFEDLGFGFGIVVLDYQNVDKISQVTSIIYAELAKTLYSNFLPSNKAACITDAQDRYGLTGEGVLVGFIDSGIDYAHPAFIDEQGNTRIECIYDLSETSKGALDADAIKEINKKEENQANERVGKLWTRADINKAIKSQDPTSIVPETDDVGHGTHVAGIACAGGKIDKKYYGAAYKASIAMVKMTPKGKINYSKSTQLLRGIKFLIDKGKEVNMPLVMSLSFSTNDGAHDGSSLLEQYINTVCKLERLSFAIAAGNEGESAHHVGGTFRTKQTINLNIGPTESGIIIQLYKNLLDDISIQLISPSGERTEEIQIQKGYKQGNVGSNKFYFYDSGAKPFSTSGEVLISLVAQNDYITSGQWSIVINLQQDKGNEYDMWLPISEGLSKETKFLQPNPFNTLGLPATVDNVIAVGSYNYKTQDFSSFSGRGNKGAMANFLRPDIVAPGENIESSIPGGEFDALSGTSMATPCVAGAAALMMQWGIVQKKDPYMYGDRLKYFLVKSAKRDRRDVSYPSADWGYGTLCLKGAMDMAVAESNSNSLRREEESARLGCGDLYQDENYENYIIQYQGDIQKALTRVTGACAFVLDENYAVVSIEKNKVDSVIDSTKEIVYTTKSSLFTLTADSNSISPLDSANINKFHQNPYLTLTGKGVLIGMVDTGIDYLNTEFATEDDKTRIISIWDQTLKGNSPMDFNFGAEYTSLDINKAIAASKAKGNPYDIVPSKDTNGHGTSMASIMGGRGKNPDLIGAAPDAEFVVVKLETARKSSMESYGVYDASVPVYDGTDILLGIKYLYSVAKKMQRPMVIHVPLGSNRGGHDGSNILERYIDSLSETRGIIVVTGTGNEGDSETHTSGKFEKSGEVKIIEVKVAEDQKDLSFEVWIKKPDKVSLSIVSPSGETIDKIPAKLQGTEEFNLVFEGSKVLVKYALPEEITGDEVIGVKIKDIRNGIWQFKLYGDNIVDGRYDVWLPQRALLKKDTKLLSPNQYVTLTIPSTAKQVLVASYYNQNNDTIVAASGRGYTRDGNIKPDVAAGGVNVLTTTPTIKVGTTPSTTTVSGSSAASAVLSGAVALILQWAVVNGKDITIYAPKIRTYLIRGASKRKGDVYPNEEWGYGKLDLYGVYDSIRDLVAKGVKINKSRQQDLQERSEEENYPVNEKNIERRSSIFIRVPEDIRKNLK